VFKRFKETTSSIYAASIYACTIVRSSPSIVHGQLLAHMSIFAANGKA
jgi:hypothetical protein